MQIFVFYVDENTYNNKEWESVFYTFREISTLKCAADGMNLLLQFKDRN